MTADDTDSASDKGATDERTDTDHGRRRTGDTVQGIAAHLMMDAGDHGRTYKQYVHVLDLKLRRRDYNPDTWDVRTTDGRQLDTLRPGEWRSARDLAAHLYELDGEAPPADATAAARTAAVDPTDDHADADADRPLLLDEYSDDVLRHATQLQEQLVMLAQRGRYGDNTRDDYERVRERLQTARDAVAGLRTVEDANGDDSDDSGGSGDSSGGVAHSTAGP